MKDTAHNSPMMAFKRRYGDVKRVESPRDEGLGVNRCRANIDSSYGKSFADLGDSFRKIIIVKGKMPPRTDENGYVMVGLIDFLLAPDSILV